MKVFSDDFSTSGPLGIYHVKYSADISSGLLSDCQNTSIADLTYTVNVVNTCPSASIQIYVQVEKWLVDDVIVPSG